jgi:tetratricopeptide (TPR) repeat protein
MEKEQLLAELKAALLAEDTAKINVLGRQMVELDENAPDGYYYLGEAALLTGQYENAELLLAKAIELDENNDNLRLRFAAVKTAKGEHEDACLVYVMVLENDANNIAALLGLAQFYLDQEQDGEQALRFIEQILAIQPTLFVAQMLKIRALLLAEEFDAALTEAQNAINSSNSEAAHLLKISILSNLVDSQAAMKKAYADLVAAYPNSTAHALNYANFLAANQEWAEAEAVATPVLNIEGYNPVAAELIGVAQSEQGKHAAAIATFDTLVAHEPQDWSVYLKRANAKLGANDSKAALLDLKEAEKYVSDASRPDLLLQQAVLFLQFGQLKEAYANYKKLSETESYEGEGFFGMAKVYQKSNTAPDKAFDALQKAIAKGQREAKDFMQTHYAAQVAALADKLTADYAAFFAQNEASKALQPLFGKVWRYSPSLNPMDDLPADLAKRFQTALADVTIIITAKGIAIANPMEKKAQLGVYKIEKESPAAVQLQLHPLDGGRSYAVQISPKGAYLLYRPAGSTDYLLLKECPAEQVAAEAKMLKKYFAPQDLDFLGDSVQFVKTVLA